MRKLVFLIALLISYHSHGQDEGIQKAKIKSISWLLGTWQSSANETNSDGNGFEQNGTCACTLSADSLSITCIKEWRVSNATGGYTRLPSRRHSVSTYSFNPKLNLYQMEESGVVHRVAYDGRSNSLIRDFMFYLPAKKTAMRGQSRITLLNANEIRIDMPLESLESDFKEMYSERLSKNKP